jgi:tellurite resistance protein
MGDATAGSGGATRVTMLSPVRGIPPNFFGFGFGLAGLGETWRIAGRYGHAPAGVANALAVLSALAWLAVLLAYLRYVIADRSALRRDLVDPVMAPFLSLALITPMFLAVLGVAPYAAQLGKLLFDVFLGLTVLVGSWFTGQWIYGSLELDKFHPAYLLPTAAGGLIGSDGAALVGQHRLAEVMFGFGVLSWLVIGSIILGRLFLRPLLPTALLPTLAIEVAPAAVASLAWFDNHGDRIDAMIAFLAGFGMLMVLAQLRLLPAYRRLPFMPGTWSFAFSWSAVASAAMHWLNDTRPAGYRAEQYLLLAAISILITAIAARTVIALCRHQLLPQAIMAGAVPEHHAEYGCQSTKATNPSGPLSGSSTPAQEATGWPSP